MQIKSTTYFEFVILMVKICLLFLHLPEGDRRIDLWQQDIYENILTWIDIP